MISVTHRGILHCTSRIFIFVCILLYPTRFLFDRYNTSINSIRNQELYSNTVKSRQLEKKIDLLKIRFTENIDNIIISYIEMQGPTHSFELSKIRLKEV